MANQGALTQLMSAGADAFTNLWDVTFTLPKSISATYQGSATPNPGATWTIRVADFNPPEFKPSTYPTDYKGLQLTRNAPKFEADRTIEFTFRIDSNWALYNDLKAWKHIFFDPSMDGNMAFGMYNDIDSNRYGRIEVVAYKASANLALTDLAPNSTTANVGSRYVFKDVVCMESGEPSLSRSDSNAVTVKAKFMFARYIEPNSSITSDTDSLPDVVTGTSV
jgi:hypothetical protein